MIEIPKVLFHTSKQRVAEGKFIHPGRWGRIIKRTGPTHPSWNREQVLEAVRASDFAEKPSRLKATFACLTRDAIEFYRRVHTPGAVIYAVELAAADAPSHVGDFNAVEPLPRRSETMTEIAKLYWTLGLRTNVAEAPGVECLELVSTSALKIVDVLDGW